MLRRLPWEEELPRSWTAAMRPTPVMIPVNICAFSQRCGGRPARRLKLVPAGDPGDDSQVGADRLEGPEFERHGLAQRRQRAMRKGPAGDAEGVADELRRQV